MQNINNFENAFGKADVDFQNNVYRTLNRLSADEVRYSLRKPRLRLVAIAAIVCVLIFGSAAALAVTGVIDFGSFYQSIFSNPEAEPYVSTTDMIKLIGSSDDLEIEPIAGFIDGEKLYIQMKITSMNDKSIPEQLYIIDGDYIVNVGDVTISHLDEKTALITFMSHIKSKDREGTTIYLMFNAISSEPISVENRPDNIPTDPPPVPVDNNDVGQDIKYSDAITFFGNWEIAVSANSILFLRYIDAHIFGLSSSVRIGATSFEIQLFSNDDNPFNPDSEYNNIENTGLPLDLTDIEDGEVFITLDDGTVIIGILQGVTFDNYIASFWYSTEFINPVNVISINFYSEIIPVHKDLIPAIGIDGTHGYVYEHMLHYGPFPRVNNPEEAMEYMEWLTKHQGEMMQAGKTFIWTIPLFAEDGVTIIGEFGVGGGSWWIEYRE